MSGVFIKGMDMPVTCCHCAFMYFDPDATNSNNRKPGSYLCSFTKEEIWNTQRDPNCPIIPVPDHGDLIDRDKLMGGKLPNNRVYQGDKRISYPPTVLQILDSVSKAPTIIPADKEEEG